MFRAAPLTDAEAGSLPDQVNELSFESILIVTGHQLLQGDKILIGWKELDGKKMSVIVLVVDGIVVPSYFEWPMKFVDEALRCLGEELCIDSEFLRRTMSDFCPETWIDSPQ